MTDYTLEQIRSVFGDGAMTAVGQDRRLAAFDKAIASVKAEALRYASARWIADGGGNDAMDFLCDMADAIVGEAISKGAGDE